MYCSASTHCIAVPLRRFLGPPLADMIRNDVKPALMTAIDSEFAKNPKREAGAYIPSRASRVEAAAKAAGGASSGAGGRGGGAKGERPGGWGAGSAAEDLSIPSICDGWFNTVCYKGTRAFPWRCIHVPTTSILQRPQALAAATMICCPALTSAARCD